MALSHYGSGHHASSHYGNGYHGAVLVTVVTRALGGRGLTKRQKIMRRDQLEDAVLMKQLVREDEELIAIVVASLDFINGFTL